MVQKVRNTKKERNKEPKRNKCLIYKERKKKNKRMNQRQTVK